MEQKPAKLGILALLLLVISICMTVLGVLAFSTAQADLRLSQRYAETTQQQYRREAVGQLFLRDADRALKNGTPLTELEGVTFKDDIYEKTVAEGNAALHVGLRLTGPESYEIVYWETSTQWSPKEETDNLWSG